MQHASMSLISATMSPAPIPPLERIINIELHCHVAIQAIQKKNFPKAHHYLSAATKLLPFNHWTTHFELSRHVYLLLANTAYACCNRCRSMDESLNKRYMEEATEALSSIIRHAHCLNDTLDANHLMISLLQSKQRKNEARQAYEICTVVLFQMGEEIPNDFVNNMVDVEYILDWVRTIQPLLQSLLEGGRENSPLEYGRPVEVNDYALDGSRGRIEERNDFYFWLMKFYNKICSLSLFVKPEMVNFFACRSVELRYV